MRDAATASRGRGIDRHGDGGGGGAAGACRAEGIRGGLGRREDQTPGGREGAVVGGEEHGIGIGGMPDQGGSLALD